MGSQPDVAPLGVAKAARRPWTPLGELTSHQAIGLILRSRQLVDDCDGSRLWADVALDVPEIAIWTVPEIRDRSSQG